MKKRNLLPQSKIKAKILLFPLNLGTLMDK